MKMFMAGKRSSGKGRYYVFVSLASFTNCSFETHCHRCCTLPWYTGPKAFIGVVQHLGKALELSSIHPQQED